MICVAVVLCAYVSLRKDLLGGVNQRVFKLNGSQHTGRSAAAGACRCNKCLVFIFFNIHPVFVAGGYMVVVVGWERGGGARGLRG